MKTKYLFGMLLGGTMLASCSTDDLDIAPVAQETNPSAPVFNLSFDDDFMTRAGWVGNDLGFQKGEDLLSLYHGIGVTKEDNKNTWDFSKYGNAIYEVTATGENGLKLETKAYVDAGVAIMVYPASLTDANRQGKAPVVTIDLEQDKNTSLLTPYISEFLSVGAYDKKGENNTAGYGREYDIKLRRLGTTAKFTLVPNEETKPDFSDYPNIPDMELNKVTLTSETEKAFTKSIALAEGTAAVASQKTYKNWVYSSDVDLTSAEGETEISTEDVTNNVATFTLLPGSASELEGCSFVVHTTYGTVTLTDEDGGVIKNPVLGSTKDVYADYQTGKDGKALEYFTVTEALDFLNKFLWTASTSETFKGENVGRALPFSEVKVDLSKVEMDGMHIKNEEKLNIALDVYEALKKTDPVQFILDGSEEDGKFLMSEDTWKRVVGIMADKDSKITFSACNDEAKCKAIVLHSENGEVPAMKFNTTSDKTSTPKKIVTTTVNIELAGIWTVNATQEEAITLDRVHTLTVQPEAILNLNGTTINVKNGISNQAYKFTVINDGTVNVTNTNYLMNAMTNHGTINILKGDANRLNMYNNGQLENCEPKGKDAVIPAVTVITDGKLGSYGGVINNSGTLAIVDNATNAWIKNYGTINVNETTARTLITSNADATADIKVLFTNTDQIGLENHKEDGTNRFGVINLQVPNAGGNNLTVKNAGEQGFIKTIGTNTKANYVVETAGSLPTSSNKYVELQKGTEADPCEYSGGITVTDALIIPENNSIFIPSDKTVSVGTAQSPGYLYLKGSITRAGKLDKTTYQHTGYFGGDTKDAESIFSMGN